MPILTRELLQNKLARGEMQNGLRFLRKKGSQEIVIGSRGTEDHQTIAEKVGIDNKDIAYAGYLTNLGVKQLVLDHGGSSFTRQGDYEPETDGEAATAAIILSLLKQIDENLDLQISNL